MKNFIEDYADIIVILTIATVFAVGYLFLLERTSLLLNI